MKMTPTLLIAFPLPPFARASQSFQIFADSVYLVNMHHFVREPNFRAVFDDLFIGDLVICHVADPSEVMERRFVFRARARVRVRVRVKVRVRVRVRVVLSRDRSVRDFV